MSDACKIPKISSARLTNQNSANSNHVYLLEFSEGLIAKPGWKIVGWSDAPYPRLHPETRKELSAIVFEKTTTDEKFTEGDRIWQHVYPEWLDPSQY